ncbi:MAG: hypothetical protein GF311_05055 [Candidatus Lokiarchaeota archaeon]|nr:hypothetical protein [Candidatus Lokiarchaeota archaeon]
MAKKTIVLSVLLLIFGSLLVPGGIVAKEYIDDLVIHETDTGLLRIREEANPIVGNLVNGTFSSSLILVASQGGLSSENFFNEISQAANFTEESDGIKLKGLSFYYGVNLSFTEESQDLILFGNSTVESDFSSGPWNNYTDYRNSDYYLPGIVTEFYDEQVNGAESEAAAWGMIDFLELIDKAIKNTELQTKLENDYNATWSQLLNLTKYIKEYVYLEGVSWSISAGRHIGLRPELSIVENSIDAIIEFYFMKQWANGSIVEDPGFPLEPIAHLTDFPYGFEVGVPLATNMSLNTSRNLWDPTNDYSLVNKNGLTRWNYAVKYPESAEANFLKIANNIDDGAYQIIIKWLPNFQKNLMPILAQYEYSLPMDSNSLSDMIFLIGFFTGLLLIGLSSYLVIRNSRKIAKKEREIARLNDITRKVN